MKNYPTKENIEERLRQCENKLNTDESLIRFLTQTREFICEVQCRMTNEEYFDSLVELAKIAYKRYDALNRGLNEKNKESKWYQKIPFVSEEYKNKRELKKIERFYSSLYHELKILAEVFTFH